MFDNLRRSAPRAITGRTGRVLATCLGVVVLLVAIGFWALPPLLRPVLEKRLAEALDRPVTIGRLELNPLTIAATLRDVRVAERPGVDTNLLAFDELYINAQLLSLWYRAPVLGAVTLVNPVAHL